MSFIKEDQEDLNDREDEPPSGPPKGLRIKEESDNELQQSVTKVLSSRSTNTQINFHPVNKLLQDSTNQETSTQKEMCKEKTTLVYSQKKCVQRKTNIALDHKLWTKKLFLLKKSIP